MTVHDLIGIASDRPIHFMGLGGAGMAPLADLIRMRGGRVTGCDSQESAILQGFAESGVETQVGHDPAHVAGCAALIATAAVRADHPEIEAARAAGIPVLKRAEALGGVVNTGYVVGIAGTHGKTTTTTLTTTLLEAAGLNPTGLVGGRVPAWGGNLRYGGDALYVVEADEFDRSFLQLSPSIAVVTTLEADHLDIFGSLEQVENAFLDFLQRVPADGLVVASADDAGVGRLIPRIGQPRRSVVTYGIAAGSMLRAESIESHGRETRFAVREHGKLLGKARIRVPGLHNVKNSLAAIGVARHLGATWAAISAGLEGFTGVDRRFEPVGEAGGILIVDDYAHHPTEIEATLQAARAAYPDRRLVAVFQPHLYTRTRDFAVEFGRSLAAADLVFVTDIYPARERPIEGVSGELIVGPARASGADVHYLPDRGAVAESVSAALATGDVCVTLGAGDLNQAARQILSRVESHG